MPPARLPQHDLHCELLSVTWRVTRWHLHLSIDLTLLCPYALGGNEGLDLSLLRAGGGSASWLAGKGQGGVGQWLPSRPMDAPRKSCFVHPAQRELNLGPPPFLAGQPRWLLQALGGWGTIARGSVSYQRAPDTGTHGGCNPRLG